MTITVPAEHETPPLALADLRETVRIIRPHNPALALSVQNRIYESLQPRLPGLNTNANSLGPNSRSLTTRSFSLSFDPFTHRRIIETLAEIGGELAQDALSTELRDPQSLDDILNLLTLWLSATQARLGLSGHRFR